MMGRDRIGQLLRQMVPLSEHDIEEILHEQAHSGRRFGEIAMEWGLCESEHVWRAWCDQTGDELEHVDLDRLGIDAQAIEALPRDVATRCRAVPLRRFDDLLIIAL